MALTRRVLDPMKCGTPGCTCAGPLILNARCHMGRPLQVEYDWTTGVLTVACSVCQRLVAEIAVADAPPPDHPGTVNWGDKREKS